MEAAPYIAAPFTGGSSLLGTKNLLTAPSPPQSPAPITTQTNAVQEASADAARRRSKSRGFSGTILKGFLDQSPQGQVLKPTMGS